MPAGWSKKATCTKCSKRPRTRIRAVCWPVCRGHTRVVEARACSPFPVNRRPPRRRPRQAVCLRRAARLCGRAAMSPSRPCSLSRAPRQHAPAAAISPTKSSPAAQRLQCRTLVLDRTYLSPPRSLEPHRIQLRLSNLLRMVRRQRSGWRRCCRSPVCARRSARGARGWWHSTAWTSRCQWVGRWVWWASRAPENRLWPE